MHISGQSINFMKLLFMFWYDIGKGLVSQRSQNIIQDHQSHLIPAIPSPRNQLNPQLGTKGTYSVPI
jgi:hypothetical protein